MTPVVACIGHQELRDMVIELRTDVKHIDERISELVEVAKNNNNRIVALETYQNQSIGQAKGVSVSSTVISGILTMIGMFLAIYISLVVK